MSATAAKAAKPMSGSPAVLFSWLALLFHTAAQSALPSEPAEVPVATPASGVVDAVRDSDGGQESFWGLSPVRLGGTLSYNLRRDSFDGTEGTNSGLIGTLNASTNTYIWQPWFARLNASLGFTKASDNSDVGGASSASSTVMVTGRGQLSVLAQSKLPFEAHFERSDNRVSNDLAVANGYASQRFGFTQRYSRLDGDAMIGWDRNTQSSADYGEDRQDSLQLRISHSLGNHQLQLNGDRSTNRHEMTGEHAQQDNLLVQHNYAPDSSISVVNMANVSRSDLQLQQGESNTRMTQLSSNMFWRPTDQRMTVNGGARVFALQADSSGFDTLGDSLARQVNASNVYAGVNYEYSRFTRLSAAFNASSLENQGLKSTQMALSMGANYQPDDVDLGFARYGWGTSVNASNRRGSEDSERALVLQISHRLSRSFLLDGGSTISVDANQGLSAGANERTSNVAPETEVPLTPTRQLIHGGSVSWDLSQHAGAALVRLSISDSRALNGTQEYFQLINFQASSSLPTSGHGSWNGNLTVQSMRQGNRATDYNTAQYSGASTSGNGSLSYQNQRFFGVRNLRFGSDLRLNIQSQQSQQTQVSQISLLSQLESRTNQEVAAWVNRIDYSIGRTQIRLNAMVSQNNVVKNSGDPTTTATSQDAAKRINRSINLMVSRSFGTN